MSAVPSPTPLPPAPDPLPNLDAFRRRIRLARAWRLGAVGGAIGGAVAAAMALLDFFSVVDCDAWMLAVPVGLGMLAGIVRAVTEPLPDSVVARSIDRRGGLADRLTTASEMSAENNFSQAVHQDAFARAGRLRPAALYPIKFGSRQGAFAAAVLCAAVIYAAGNTDLFRTMQQKRDAASLKQTAKEVERVARPEIDAAKAPDATAEDKALARELRRFTQDLNKGRMTKQEALVRANQLSEQANRIQQNRASALAQSVQKAQTASMMLKQMASQAGLEKAGASALGSPEQQAEMQAQADKLNAQSQAMQAQMQSLQGKIDQLQKALDANKTMDGKSLSPAERAVMQKQLEKMQKQIEELAKMLSKIKLSQRALDFMKKLSQMPDFQAAQAMLQKLAQDAQAQQAGAQPGDPQTMTPEQMKETADALEAQAKALEEMAKQYGSDEKMEELARQMLEAAREARLGNGSGVGLGLMGAFGLGMGPHQNGPSGPGSPYDRWSGYTNKPPMSDKSSLLNVKLQDRIITSQIGTKGSETYTEVTGPTTPTGRSSVPYQAVLPKYEKSAESALNRSDIPPSERAKVRDYFNSLRK